VAETSLTRPVCIAATDISSATLNTPSSSSQRLATRAPYVLHAVAFDVPLQVRSSSEHLLEALRQRLPHSSQIVPKAASSARCYTWLEPAGGHGSRLYVNARKFAEDADYERLMDRFAGAAMLHVAECATGFVFVHAGVVAWQDRAIVFPGRSLSGKSTLTAALVRAGAVYYSDDYALLDPAGFVHPFARELQMRTPGSWEQTAVAVDSYGGVAGSIPIRIGSVCLTRYRSDYTWQPRTIPTGQGILQTMRHAVAMRASPVRVLSTLSAALAEATIYSNSRGEADSTAAAMLAQL
jgi:hypothetical protein